MSEFKIFPRNLTARADAIVRGNPMSSRPESGVDNCYPGLEFDQRNLDKAFFPGLVFEFHRPDGAVVHRIPEPGVPVVEIRDGVQTPRLLTAADLPLSLWALAGHTTGDRPADAPPSFSFAGLDGLEVWRRVHDLLPGRIAIVLGPGPGTGAPGGDAFRATMLTLRRQNRSAVRAAADGTLQFAVLVADRARYLDDDGVIDVDAYPPGELTRSLCAPWQYDFRDCGCFYWAASKPDIATSSDGGVPYVNFQRADRSEPPALDLPVQAGRRELEIDYADLVGGAWNDLPVVLDDRERRGSTPTSPTPVELGRDEVLAELAYLATVEHALCVEYLFAHYSLNAPARVEDARDDVTRRVHAAAAEILAVAIDEMRHFRWVNEMLALLGEPVSLGRAERIGRSFNRPFQLEPLTPEQLDWFIAVEKPSQDTESDVDGMYVRLHATIDVRPDLFPERERLVHLIKLIIDEGGEHYLRFRAVKNHLAGLTPERYLRAMGEPTTDHDRALLRLSEQNYDVMLQTLRATFTLGDRAGGLLLEQARRAMVNLHDTNHLLARRGVRPLFTLPPQK